MEKPNTDDHGPIWETLEWSVRAGNVLKRESIDTIEQLMGLDRETVMKWKHAGQRTWFEIRDMQHYFADDGWVEKNLMQCVSMLNGVLLEMPSGYSVRINDDGLLEVHKRIL